MRAKIQRLSTVFTWHLLYNADFGIYAVLPEEFGTYTRYTYYRPEACVILSSNGKTLVLSGSSAESTRSLYDTLAAKTGL